MPTWNQQLRTAVKKSGLSVYAIAKAAGLRVSAVQNFAAGVHGVTLDSAEKLAAVVGIEFKPAKSKAGE